MTEFDQKVARRESRQQSSVGPAIESGPGELSAARRRPVRSGILSEVIFTDDGTYAQSRNVDDSEMLELEQVAAMAVAVAAERSSDVTPVVCSMEVAESAAGLRRMAVTFDGGVAYGSVVAGAISEEQFVATGFERIRRWKRGGGGGGR